MKKYVFLALMICGLTVLFCNQTHAGNTNIGLVILESGEVLSGTTSSYFPAPVTGHITTGSSNTGHITTGSNTSGGGGGVGGGSFGGVGVQVGGGTVAQIPKGSTKPIIPIVPLLPLPPLVPVVATGSNVGSGIKIPDTIPTNPQPVVNSDGTIQGGGPISVEPEVYNPEIQSAFDYAKSVGITNMPSIHEARMFDQITRAEFAKMIVVMGRDIQQRTIVKQPRCEIGKYADVDTGSREAPYISDVCNMGVMGWLNDKSAPITNFRPYDYITRAEIGTVLSRFLFGGKFNGDPTGSYYESHLKALQEAGYMKKIDEPLKNEFRGYVMVMLQRIAK